MTFSKWIPDPLTGELVEHCVPDCGDMYDENEESGECDPKEPEEGPIVITPPPEPVPEPPITCEQELEFDLTNVTNFCETGNSMSFSVEILPAGSVAYDYIEAVNDAINAHVDAFYDGGDIYLMDFTLPFEWNGETAHHVQNAWSQLIRNFDATDQIQAIFNIEVTNCAGGKKTFQVGPRWVQACGSYTWELVPIPPCDWSRRLYGYETPEPINLEKLRAEHEAKQSHGYSLYYIIAAAVLVLGAAAVVKKTTDKKKVVVANKPAPVANTSSDSDTTMEN